MIMDVNTPPHALLQAISVLPGEPDVDEALPPIPGAPIVDSGDRSKDIMLALARLLRAEGNEDRARELETHEHGSETGQ